jgi:hypothetical protein
MIRFGDRDAIIQRARHDSLLRAGAQRPPRNVDL